MPMGGASPVLPPTPADGRSPTSKFAIVNAPAPKTVSATSKTRACVTCHFTGSARTRSGWRSSAWPLTCWSGPRPWRSPPSPPAAGNPSVCVYDCFTWPDASSVPGGATAYVYHADGPGTISLKTAGPHYNLAKTEPRYQTTTQDQENRRTTAPENHSARSPRTHPSPLTHPITRPDERSRLKTNLRLVPAFDGIWYGVTPVSLLNQISSKRMNFAIDSAHPTGSV